MEDKVTIIKEEAGWCLIPPAIFSRKDLSANEKMLCGRIFGLSRNDGYCYASNTYLANDLGLEKRSISRTITKLDKKGVIKVQILRDSRKVVAMRKIYPLWTQMVVPLDKVGSTPTTKNVHELYNTVTIDITNNSDVATSDVKKVVKKTSSCPLESPTFSLKAKYPNGHKECIEFIDSVAELKGHKFANYPKQIGAIHKMLRAERNFAQISATAMKIKKNQFYLDKGWDLVTVANQLDKE